MSASDQKVLHWGIIGCGKICQDFVLAQRFSEKPHKVVAVSTSNSVERAKKFCDDLELKETKYYGSYDDLLKDPNVVYIGIWNNKHMEWTIKALEAGKNVLCEKPMGCNSKEVAKMIQTAKEKNLFLMEAFWSRFFPTWLHIRKLVKSKKYGKVQMCHANFGVQLPDTRKCVNEAETPVLDIGVYTVMFSMLVFDGVQPKKITVASEKNEEGSDLWANITLDYGSGQHSAIYYNSNICSPTNAYICFEKALIPQWFWSPEELTIQKYPITSNSKDVEHLKFPLGDEKIADKFNFNNSSGLHYEADHVYERLNAGHKESDIISLNESIEIHKLLDRIRAEMNVTYPQDK